MYSFERYNFTNENISTSLDTNYIRQSDNNIIISPKTACPLQTCPIHIERERIDHVFNFEQYLTKNDKKNGKLTNVPIYNSRAAYFFKTKMGIDGLDHGKEGTYSICKKGNKCCSTLTHHFFVMPQFTNWATLGDFAVVMNLNHPEQPAAYAICADLGPDETVIDDTGTRFRGQLGECSNALGRYLKISGSEKYSPDTGLGGDGFERDNIVYIVFPGSGLDLVQNENFTLEEVNKQAHRHFQCWGGWKFAQLVVKKKYGIDLK